MATLNSNPPQPVPIVQRIPTRIVPSGTITLNAGASQTFPGSNNRQDRVQFVITNLDGSQLLKLTTTNGGIWGSVLASTKETYETSADIVVLNPGSNSVQFEVGEFYPDTGNYNAVPLFQQGNAAVPAAGAGAAGSGSGSAGSGAAAGGSSGFGSTGFGSRPRQAQTP